MSADNGVYILECKDQFRVVHLQAIDNIRWSFIEMAEQREPVPSRIVEMFGRQKYTRDRDTALRVASAILRSLLVCEYGINYIHINKRWNQVMEEARELAVIEVECIGDNPNMICFTEDETDPKWMFWEGDLNVVERVEDKGGEVT